MSRIGKLPIPIPNGVIAQIVGSCVTVKGPKGELSQTFDPCVSIQQEEQSITVTPKNQDPSASAMHGTVRAIVANMVQGVQTPFSKDLEVKGVGFKASVSGDTLTLNLGYSDPIKYLIRKGITIQVKDNTQIHVEGPDRCLVGQVAADIKRFRKIEPYKGRGVRIIGEHVPHKEGKKKA